MVYREVRLFNLGRFDGLGAEAEVMKRLWYASQGIGLSGKWPDSSFRAGMYLLTGRRRTISAAGLGMRGKTKTPIPSETTTLAPF